MQAELIVGAYYTRATGYAEEVRRLLESMRPWGLCYVIWEIADHGGWQANTHFKAEFLRELVCEYEGRKILYVDADAVFRESPAGLARLDADIAVHYLQHANGSEELLSGTILLSANRLTLELLARWRAENRANPFAFDQVNLARAIQTMPSLRVYRLPPEYAFIFDIMRRCYPTLSPVIEHFQASRRYRNPGAAGARGRSMAVPDAPMVGPQQVAQR